MFSVSRISGCRALVMVGSKNNLYIKAVSFIIIKIVVLFILVMYYCSAWFNLRCITMALNRLISKKVTACDN